MNKIIQDLYNNRKITKSVYEKYIDNPVVESILRHINNFVSLQDISKQENMSYQQVYSIVNRLKQDQVIIEKEYKIYKKTVSLERQKKLKQNILDMLRSGEEPMRISEKVGMSRQRIYQIMDWFVKEKIITKKERQDFLIY